MEPVLAVLASCGIHGREEAIHAARGLRSVAHGFATLEEAGGFGMADAWAMSPSHVDAGFFTRSLRYQSSWVLVLAGAA